MVELPIHSFTSEGWGGGGTGVNHDCPRNGKMRKMQKIRNGKTNDK